MSTTIHAEEQQITFSPKGHDLDNDDNFSPDGRYLVYDTRETYGPGIEHGIGIELLNLETGEETLLYQPERFVFGKQTAPGIGAASFSPVANEIAFIHGPPLEEVPVRGWYGKPNRGGGWLRLDGLKVTRGWLDYRDIDTSRDTLPGAHRGGTHRHEFNADGQRIGFTYDDFLLPQYDRTVGYMEPHDDAPGEATHYVAMLVPVTPKGTAKAGELEKAWGDSWVGAHGEHRAFIGKVKEADGTYQQSLFVVDVPVEVDITTADSGSATRFPTPPAGTTIRRLTHTFAEGIVRGSKDGGRIAYFAEDANGVSQVFVISVDGSDESDNPALRPHQVTTFESGTEHSLRWHPSGETLFCIADNGVAAVCAEEGAKFGEHRWLTPHGDAPERTRLVVSPDGALLAFNKPTPMVDAKTGQARKNYAGEDHLQIWTVDYAEAW